MLFCSCVLFSHFSIAITSLGEERAKLSALCTFVRFALVWFCLFPLSLGVWEGLRFVIVALPGLFSYFFFIYLVCFVVISLLFGASRRHTLSNKDWWQTIFYGST